MIVSSWSFKIGWLVNVFKMGDLFQLMYDCPIIVPLRQNPQSTMRLQKIFPTAEFFVEIEAKPLTDNLLRQSLNMLIIELSVCSRFGDLCIYNCL